MLQVTVTDEGEGRRRMAAGQASAMVVIPKGFALDLLENKPVTLEVVKNPSEQFLPDVVEELMNTMAVMLSGAVQAFADEARGIRSMLDTPLEGLLGGAGAGARQGPEKVIAAEKYLNPLIVRLKEEEARADGAAPGSPGRISFGHPSRHDDHVPAVHRPDRDARPPLRARGRQAPAADDATLRPLEPSPPDCSGAGSWG